MTHRTDDMAKLPPRLPVNAPKPKKPAQANRPKLRLLPPAKPAGPAPSSPAPEAHPAPTGPASGVAAVEADRAVLKGPASKVDEAGPSSPPPGSIPDSVLVPGSGGDVVMDETGDMPERVGEVGGAVGDAAVSPQSPGQAHAGRRFNQVLHECKPVACATSCWSCYGTCSCNLMFGSAAAS